MAVLRSHENATPRHGTSVFGGAIHIAGGGPMNGGVFQSSIHEVFTL